MIFVEDFNIFKWDEWVVISSCLYQWHFYNTYWPVNTGRNQRWLGDLEWFYLFTTYGVAVWMEVRLRPELTGTDCRISRIQLDTIVKDLIRSKFVQRKSPRWYFWNSSCDLTPFCFVLNMRNDTFTSLLSSEDSYIMTSSNGNIFRVTGHLCGEFTGPRWIPHTKASDAELWCLLWSAPG